MIRYFYNISDVDLRDMINTIFDDRLTLDERSIYDSTFISNTIIERVSISNNPIEVRMTNGENYWVIIDTRGILLNKRLRLKFKDEDFSNYLETII